MATSTMTIAITTMTITMTTTIVASAAVGFVHSLSQTASLLSDFLSY